MGGGEAAVYSFWGSCLSLGTPSRSLVLGCKPRLERGRLVDSPSRVAQLIAPKGSLVEGPRLTLAAEHWSANRNIGKLDGHFRAASILEFEPLFFENDAQLDFQ